MISFSLICKCSDIREKVGEPLEPNPNFGKPMPRAKIATIDMDNHVSNIPVSLCADCWVFVQKFIKLLQDTGSVKVSDTGKALTKDHIESVIIGSE